mmetsp:Transcript_1344/g.2258  ORF Transcript_1344/g.2258 Transcript_1344/m.2258 type:complete len:92 (+) Transcript_1344:103-378(+)
MAELRVQAQLRKDCANLGNAVGRLMKDVNGSNKQNIEAVVDATARSGKYVKATEKSLRLLDIHVQGIETTIKSTQKQLKYLTELLDTLPPC